MALEKNLKTLLQNELMALKERNDDLIFFDWKHKYHRVDLIEKQNDQMTLKETLIELNKLGKKHIAFQIGDKVQLKDPGYNDIFIIEEIDKCGNLIVSWDGKRCIGSYNPEIFDLIEENDDNISEKIKWML